jgi:hypothetical protein
MPQMDQDTVESMILDFGKKSDFPEKVGKARS